MTIGHVMLDLHGVDLTSLEKELLRHPQVGGVILFSRNYDSKKQLRSLTKSIRSHAKDCLIAVDQEGGRVQHFKTDFCPLPSFRTYGNLYEMNSREAVMHAQKMAFEMAKELREVGVNLSFTPVLDIDIGRSQVIGDRSFHHNSDIVVKLGKAFINGMHRAGMPATGKHFPGHGYVAADSHMTLPVDDRQYDEIMNQDMVPFLKLNQELDGIMPAHILYKNVDSNSTCFSNFWLQDILRTQLNFNGVIFSDDLSMAGAEFVSDYEERAKKALAAGCDMVLICNQQEQAIRILDAIERYNNLESANRLKNFGTVLA